MAAVTAAAWRCLRMRSETSSRAVLCPAVGWEAGCRAVPPAMPHAQCSACSRGSPAPFPLPSHRCFPLPSCPKPPLPSPHIHKASFSLFSPFATLKWKPSALPHREFPSTFLPSQWGCCNPGPGERQAFARPIPVTHTCSAESHGLGADALPQQSPPAAPQLGGPEADSTGDQIARVITGL